MFRCKITSSLKGDSFFSDGSALSIDNLDHLEGSLRYPEHRLENSPERPLGGVGCFLTVVK